jgi:hypothetical protein
MKEEELIHIQIMVSGKTTYISINEIQRLLLLDISTTDNKTIKNYAKRLIERFESVREC